MARSLNIRCTMEPSTPLEQTPAVPFHCDHFCAFDCRAMFQAIDREETLLQYYEQLLSECDYPDVRELLAALVRERRVSLKRLRERFKDINSHFDPAGV